MTPSPDLQFLTPAELDRVIDVIPVHVVDKDALGPVVRLVLLAAGTTGVRQPELLGMRWRDVGRGSEGDYGHARHRVSRVVGRSAGPCAPSDGRPGASNCLSR